MRAGNPRARTGGWTRIDIDLARTGALMREAGFVGCDLDPIEGHAHRDRAGRVRRIHATWKAGWRATLVLRLDGSFSLSQAIKFVGQKPAS